MIEDILSLMHFSKVHKRWYVEDIFDIIMPPLDLGQCIIVRESDKIVGFGTFGFLSNEALDKFLTGSAKLTRKDFNSGPNVVLVDVIAPYGHARQITSKMRDRLIELGHWGKIIKYVRHYGNKRVLKESVI
jgi:cytolysin-activating lysine-acyltransferase